MRRMCAFNEGILKRMQARIRPWKDRYKGERCFCIGNGPSLKDTPLHLLNNEYTFGLNRIAKIYPMTTWRPSFYVNVTIAVMDGGWASDAKEAMKDTPSFVGYGNLPYVMDSDAGHITIPPHIFPISISEQVRHGKPYLGAWSYDIAENISKYGSSMLSVMQVAVYMGFNPLIMVGCDLRWDAFDYHEDKDPNHFSDDYWGRMNLGGKEIPVTPHQAKRYTDDARASHILAKMACDEVGVKIYNATIGGELEIYPRVDFMQIVQDA